MSRTTRLATSAQSDNSEMDLDGTAESELAKLQRQFRIMERDRQAYSIQARRQICKQQQEIDLLVKQQQELQRNLGVRKSASSQQKVGEDTERICALWEKSDMLDKEVEKEKQSQKELQTEISRMELKLAELRKGVSDRNTQKSETQQIQKAKRTLESKLNLATTRLNEHQTKNSQLREEVQVLLVERGRFHKLRNRLEKELQDVRKSIGEIINLSIAAYKDRAEAQTKMTMMREKAVKDFAQENAEMRELKMVIALDYSLKEFVMTKCSERGRLDDSHDMGQLSKVKEKQKTDSGEQSLDALEQVFERIQKVTGEENLDMLVTRFIQDEDRNFALFNFVNEQNNEVETLKEQISQIQEHMEQFRVKDLQQQQDHRSLLRDLDAQQMEIECQADENENQVSIISKVLDEIIQGVNSTFSKMECDQSVLKDMTLARGFSGISNNNIVSYLGLLEQKTNELLSIQAFLSSKDMEKNYNSRDLAKFLLGQNPDLLQQNISIQPAVNNVAECDADEFLFTDEEERPLSQGELRKRIMNGFLRDARQ